MRRLILRVLFVPVLVTAIIVLLVSPFVVIYSGAYDVAATRQHTAPVYWALITTLRQSIQAYAAREVGPPPDLSLPELADHGLRLYDRHCAMCHGAPGRSPEPVGLGLTPPPANLTIASRDWTPEEIFWTVSKGLKMTGMPAWEYRLTHDERWAVVAFVKAMFALTPAEYEVRLDAVLARDAGGEQR